MKLLQTGLLFRLILLCFMTSAVHSRPIPASFVMEVDTGRVLHHSNASHKVFPASLTKMMTLYLMFDAFKSGKLRMDSPIAISRKAAAQAPTKLGVRAGQSITAGQAMYGMIVKSANDAALAVAEHLGGSEAQFAQIMTRKARELGMINTTFYNASGLPHHRQQTTARDMAMLAKALIRNHPEYYRFFSTKAFQFRGCSFRNHNKLLGRVEGVDGIKTGYTRAAGFNLTTSAVYNNKRIIAVVMGGTSGRARDAKMRNLLRLAMNQVETGTASQLRRDPSALIMAQKQPQRSNKRVQLAQASHARRSNWGVQVGAFRSIHQAKLTANKALRHVKVALGIQPQLQLHKVRKSRVTHSRLVAMTENQAKQACKALMQKNMSCMALKVGTARRIA